MNIESLNKRINQEFGVLGLELIKKDDSILHYKANIVAEDLYDDNIFFDFVISSNNMIMVSAIFDEIEVNANTLELLNQLNQEMMFAKASYEEIEGSHYLVIHYNFLSNGDEDFIVHIINFVLDDIVSDEMADSLIALTGLTNLDSLQK